MEKELTELIEVARERPITREELRQQREAFAYGNLPGDRPTTRADVKRALEAMEGAA